MTAATNVDPAPFTAAATIARPPEAWTVMSQTPFAASAAAAAPTWLGMSWSLRSQKTLPCWPISKSASGP